MTDPRSASIGSPPICLLAIILYGYTIWLVLELGSGARRDDPKLRREGDRR